MTIDPNSKFYNWITNFCLFVSRKDLIFWGETNICRLVWMVIESTILTFILVSVAIAMASMLIAYPLGELIAALVFGFGHFSSLSNAAGIVWCISILVFGFVLFLLYADDNGGVKGVLRKAGFQLKEDNLMLLWYRSIKEKTCFTIKVKTKDASEV